MSNLSFVELVDIEQIRQLLEAQYKLAGILAAILDTEENVLAAVGWQDICVQFHRSHPATCARCRDSDAYIKQHLLYLKEDYVDYRCLNGLRDVAMPIIIGGEHVATLFTGQFFYDDEKPDVEFFRAQAEEFGFDKEAYLEALGRVPICSREKVRNVMEYFRSLVTVIAEMGLKNLELRESRDYLDNIINTIADPIIVKDKEHRLVLVNDAVCALAGRGREEMIGRSDYAFFPKEQADVFWEKDAAVLETELETINEEEITNAQGQKRMFYAKKSLYRDLKGDKYVVGVVRDITDLKRKEMELRALNENLESRVVERTFELEALNSSLVREFNERKQTEQRIILLNFALDHVREEACLIDEQARFRYVNEEACRAFGYSRDELLSMKAVDVDPNVPLEEWPNRWQEVKERGSLSFESSRRCKDGRMVPTELTVSHIKYEESEYILVLARDITERKKAEDEIARRQRQLECLNETLEKRVAEEVRKNREKDVILIQQNRQAALGEMLDHIAHQWKQPLNSISLIIQELELVAHDGELTNEYTEETVSKIMALLEHMAQTIDVFRDFYRPEKEKTVFRLKDSIDKAIGLIAPVLSLHGVTVEIDVDPGLVALGHPKEYAQVMLNLFGNAKNALVERKIKNPRIKVKACIEDKKAVVTITDNAGGIPGSNIDRIFEPFFSTRKEVGGTGVGLYMSKSIIEKNMGGTLSAANVDGGAQFRVEIPAS